MMACRTPAPIQNRIHLSEGSPKHSLYVSRWEGFEGSGYGRLWLGQTFPTVAFLEKDAARGDISSLIKWQWALTLAEPPGVERVHHNTC